MTTWAAVVGLGTGLVHLFGFQAVWLSWFVTRDFLKLVLAVFSLVWCLVLNHEMPHISLCLKKVGFMPWV